MGRRLIVGAVVVSLIMAAGGAGCGAPSRHAHGGQLVTEYPQRRRPEFGWTRVPAVYVLYSQKDPPGGYAGAKKVKRVGWELTEVRLGKRRPLGFKVVNGSLVAVAGDDQISLPPGDYCWHTRPGSEPVDWGKTALLATVIVVAVAAVAVVSVGVSVSKWGSWGAP